MTSDERHDETNNDRKDERPPACQALVASKQIQKDLNLRENPHQFQILRETAN